MKTFVLLTLCIWIPFGPVFSRVVVAPSPPPEEFTLWTKATAEKSLIDGVEGERAALVVVHSENEHPYDTLLHSVPNTEPIAKGDIIVYSLRVRATGEPVGMGEVILFFDCDVKSKQGGLHTRLYPTTDLKTYRRAIAAPYDYGAGELKLSVHLGAKVQSLEIYSVAMEVFPAGTPYAGLGVDEITWDGKSPDAPWRKAATERIERLRKSDLEVSVTDADGVPVEGAKISVAQVEHAWRFGVFVNDTLIEDSPDGERYREELKKRFNFITVPTYLAKWGWLNEKKRRSYFAIADWAQENGIRARGHLLVYPGWTATPGEWFELPKDELRQRLSAHIPRAIKAFRERGITEWDVTNELRYNETFMNEIGGVEVAAEWFRLAREHNPGGRHYLSETWLLPSNANTEVEQATFEKHIRYLLSYEAPIDALAMHGHFGEVMTAPEKLKAIFDRFAKFGRPIHVSEFDMNNDDKQAQADYLRDFLTLCFSHPIVDGVTLWGMWEKRMWKPRGYLFSKSWDEAPAARAYLDLVKGDWWTEESGETAGDGTWSTRAFKGTHRVTVSHSGYEFSRQVDLDDGSKLAVTVP